MTSNYTEIQEYLLGGLDQADRETLELRVIEDEEFGFEAMAAEDQLIESYIDGELSDADAGRFRSDYLVTEARVKRLKELAALRAAVANSSPVEVDAVEKGFSGIFNWFSPVFAMGTAAIVLVAVAGLWIYFFNEGATDLEQQYASLNRGDMSDLNRFATNSKVELFPGTFRSSDGGTKIATGNLSEAVLFRLPLGFDPPPEYRYRVLVLRDEKGVFEVDDLQPVRDGSVTEVRVLLPKSILERGQYQIRLGRYETKDAPVVFNFTVE